jgi:molybdate transport system substrate-binding protein
MTQGTSMPMFRSKIIGMAAVGVLAVATQSFGAEVTALASSGSNGILRILASEFEKQTGNKVMVSAEQSRAMAQKLENNAPADLVALSGSQFDELAAKGKVVAETVKIFARAGNGVAVKAGSRKPDISTPEAFKQAMLSAKSIGHTDSGTGPFNTQVFQKLGIYDQIKDKIKIISGGVGEAVAAGEVEIGIQQASVIMRAAGTDFVGPLPPELTEYSDYGIAVLSVAKDAVTARSFITFLGSSQVAEILRRNGMEAVNK